MKNLLKDSVYRYAFLLIGSIWLFILSFIFSNYWSYTSSIKGVRKNLEKYIKGQEIDVKFLSNDTNFIYRLIHGNYTEAENTKLVEKSYGFFIYQKNTIDSSSLKYWNSQLVLPDIKLVEKNSGNYFESLQNGQYDLVIHDVSIKNEKYKIIALIPIRWNFFIENNYLRNGFVSQLNADKNFEIGSDITNYSVKSIEGKTLFYICENKGEQVFHNDWITVLLRLFAVLLLMFFFHELALLVSRKFGYVFGIICLLTLVIIFRIFTYFFNFPLDFKQFELFSPSVYGSNIILKSLGDLIINAIFFVWLIYFIRKQIKESAIIQTPKSDIKKHWIYVLMYSLYAIVTILYGMCLRTLVSDSSISFDVNNYFSLNIYTLFGFMTLCLISIGYIVSTQIIFKFIKTVNDIHFQFKYILIFLLGYFLVYIFLNELTVFQMGIYIWLIIYYLLYNSSLTSPKFNLAINKTLVRIFIFSILITIIISSENRKKELEERIRASEKIAWESDPYGEKLFSFSLDNLTNDFWLRSLQKMTDPKSVNLFKDSLLRANFNSNLSLFQTSIHFFDSSGNSIFKNNSSVFDSLNSVFELYSRKTTLDGLKYANPGISNFRYIYHKSVIDNENQVKGSVFITYTPKKVKAETFIPKLLNLNNPESIYKSAIYSYAVYDKGFLETNFNNFPFPSVLDQYQTKFKETKIENIDGFNKLWYKQSNDRIVVIVRRSNFILEYITLFSYLFFSFLLLIGLINFFSFIIDIGFSLNKFKKSFQLNIKSQLFSTILILILFSFIVIMSATVYFYIDRYNRNNEEKISKTIQLITDDFSKDMGQELELFYFCIKSGKTIPSNMSDKLMEIAEIHNVDLNLYDKNGKLILTSQPIVYNEGILSTMMNPKAYYQLNNNQKVIFLQSEKTGELEYLSAYKPVISNEKKNIAFFNVPYFSSSFDLKQEISNFLVTIININAFIFLIAGLFAVFLINKITGSFVWIGQKMRDINFGKENELITWNRNDEIGELVKEYNKMVLKLDENIKSLAKTEREGAWREMAKQVAHEIKNPLTPMKLSIQYLQRSIDTNASNFKELTTSVARTLIEQIEHLSKIASEFSQFANIGNPKNEKIEINSFISSIVSFHSSHVLKNIQWLPLEENVFIFADKTQMNRLFNNLIRNAFEAIPDEKHGMVSISGYFEKGLVTLKISDTGTGIPENMHDKIFAPNFTTKTSGTGLGLAICKGIVEQAKGKIWFKPNTDGGTSFYIALPIFSDDELK